MGMRNLLDSEPLVSDSRFINIMGKNIGTGGRAI